MADAIKRQTFQEPLFFKFWKIKGVSLNSLESFLTQAHKDDRSVDTAPAEVFPTVA